ncbi:MAG: hypothetical protein KAS86_05045 [Candidatus Omnitrophica bacterium]|nr:hypothetical protein [Candidatus Omnitrophota bacterium]
MKNEQLFRFCFGCPPSDFSETVVITPFLPLRHFKAHCDAGPVFKGRLYSGFTAVKNGKDITVVQCGMGDGPAGDAVLLLGCTRARDMVFAGTCGGFNGCGIGGFIVSEGAFNGEGFSRYYEPDFDMERLLASGKMMPADPAYTEELTAFLEGCPDRMAVLDKGFIFTVGSLLAEQRENLLRVREKGFKGIDMELSAVYRAAAIAGIRAAGFLVVSDIPLVKNMGDGLDPSERKAFNRGIQDQARFTLEFASLAQDKIAGGRR